MGKPTAKILIWDIETTDFKADWGIMLAAGYQWLGKPKVTVKNVLEYEKWQDRHYLLDDKDLVTDFSDVLKSADMWVTYYGKGFDLKFMNTRMLDHGLSVLPNIPHVDLYFTVRGNMALTSKGLANVSEFLRTDENKTPLKKRVWRRAGGGDPEAMAEVVRHCRQDIKVTLETYLRLRPLIRTHPRVSGYGPCRVCGGTKLRSKGLAMTILHGQRQRVQCQECGSYENRPMGSVSE